MPPKRRTVEKRVMSKWALATRKSDDDDDDDFVNPRPRTVNNPSNVEASSSKANDEVLNYDTDEEKKGKAFIQMRCSPAVIYNVVSDMCDDLKKTIVELGFGKLLEMKIDALDDRQLALFLVRCLKEDPFRLEIGNKVLPITPEAVSLVFGIPASGKRLPEYKPAAKREARAELRKICDEKGMKAMFAARRHGKYDGLGASEVPRWVIETFANAKNADDWTVKSFLMLVFNALLFPTGSDKMVGLDYLMCKDLSAVKEINWCQAVVDDIKVKSRDFNAKFDVKNQRAPNVQGCTAFLVVYYLDNLLCEQMTIPAGTPRSKHFNSTTISTLSGLDKLKDVPSSDVLSYGYLPLKNPSDTVYANVRAAVADVQHGSGDADVVKPVFVKKPGHKKSNVRRPTEPSAEAGPSADCDEELLSGFPHLDPILSGVIASLPDDKRDAASKALKTFDKNVSNAMRNINMKHQKIQEAQHKIDEAQRQIKEAQREIKKNQLSIDREHKSLVDRVKVIVRSSDTEGVPTEEPSARDARAAKRHAEKQTSCGSGKTGSGKRQKKSTDEAQQRPPSSSATVPDAGEQAPSKSPVADNIQLTGSSTEIVVFSQSQSVTGVHEQSFDREEWHDKALFISAMDDDSTPPQHVAGDVDGSNAAVDRSNAGDEKQNAADEQDVGNTARDTPITSGTLAGGIESEAWQDITNVIHSLNMDPTQQQLRAEVLGGEMKSSAPAQKSDAPAQKVVPKPADVSSDKPAAPTEQDVRKPAAISSKNQDQSSKEYTHPGPRITRSRAAAENQLRSPLHTGETRKIRKDKKKAQARKNQKKQKKDDVPELDEDGFQRYDASLFASSDEFPDWLNAEQIFLSGPASVTNFGNRVSPFTDEWRRVLPDADAALELRASIFQHREEEEYKNLCYIRYSEKFHQEDLDDGLPDITYQFVGSHDIYSGFADKEMGNSDHIDYFSLCVLDDDKTFRKNTDLMSESYRIILPTNVSSILLLDEDEYDETVLLKFIRMRFKAMDIIRSSLIFVPVVKNAHWTVYCINKVHGQIDILDPQNWEQIEDKNRYHMRIAEKLRVRLSRALKEFAGDGQGSFTEWSMTYVNVPTQNPKNDCAFFCMLYIENYNAYAREMDIEIVKDRSDVYRAQLLQYMLFHRLNQAPRPFPDFIQQFSPAT